VTVRTRFAPSPTGYLHIGNARAALFAFLFARQHQGTFILRIDDTDRQRFAQEFLDDVLDSLRWLELPWDEGPYFQSQRSAVYRDAARRLFATGQVYPCYCRPEELDAKRREALAAGRKPMYDGKCRDLPPQPPEAGPYVLRFRTPREGETVVDDMVKGSVAFRNRELDDLILIRSDGTPTYNFCSVVDDVEMGISHVIRGDDHLNNTPRQVLLLRALGAAPPLFAHLPLILEPDRAPLSKRHGATSVRAYREDGYLPDALVNFLARLGWSAGDQEVFSRAELLAQFRLEDVGKAAGVFNAQKLLWLNFHHLKQMPVRELAAQVRPFILRQGYALDRDEGWLERIVATLQPRAKTLAELVEFARFYLSDDLPIDPAAKSKFLTSRTRPALALLRERLARVADWRAGSLESAFADVQSELQVALGAVAQPLRVALTGGTVSPGIFEVAEALGKERTLARLDRALAAIPA